ncbi:Uncharacterised protein [Sphingobacterium spiritivorum]|uniref:Uncharacterized protein n=1 Tax=Sphingobacterium spiritivorum TaxID=258 RepID=A0A380BIF2_SPHSI|nr:Uncharacterised protein [Sphingobacterium spiritivorum]
MKKTNYYSDQSSQACVWKKQVFTLGFSLLLLANVSYASDGHLFTLESPITSNFF